MREMWPFPFHRIVIFIYLFIFGKTLLEMNQTAGLHIGWVHAFFIRSLKTFHVFVQIYSHLFYNFVLTTILLLHNIIKSTFLQIQFFFSKFSDVSFNLKKKAEKPEYDKTWTWKWKIKGLVTKPFIYSSLCKLMWIHTFNPHQNMALCPFEWKTAHTDAVPTSQGQRHWSLMPQRLWCKAWKKPWRRHLYGLMKTQLWR